MKVELLLWPAEDKRRDLLGQRRCPRILLVAPDVEAPITVDPLEDWIRLPNGKPELQARIESLQRRATPPTRLDDDGVLRRGDQRVALPPVEEKLMAVLLTQSGKVVTRYALLRAGWPGQEPRRNVLDVQLVRLRRRLAPLGLTITTVRKRGYLLDV